MSWRSFFQSAQPGSMAPTSPSTARRAVLVPSEAGRVMTYVTRYSTIRVQARGAAGGDGCTGFGHQEGHGLTPRELEILHPQLRYGGVSAQAVAGRQDFDPPCPAPNVSVYRKDPSVSSLTGSCPW